MSLVGFGGVNAVVDSMIIDNANASGDDDADDDMSVDTDASIAIGYQAPNVDSYLADDDTLLRLLANDPGVASLFLETTYAKAEQVGVAIGKNTYLREVELSNLDICNQYYGADLPPKIAALFESLCRSLAINRSIENLKMKHFDHSHVDIFPILAPFFEHNQNLRFFDVSQSKNFAQRIPSLASALVQSNMNQLEGFDLWRNEIGDVQSANLFNALTDMPGLRNLLELRLGFNGIGIEGCKSLGKLLTNPSSRVQCLNLYSNAIDDSCVEVLVGALVMNSTIVMLNLGCQEQVTPRGWQTFSTFLSNPNCSLASIDLNRNKIGDEGAASLGESMALNTALKIKGMDISSCTAVITSDGWQRFSRCLSAPSCALEKLNLSHCAVDDGGALAIISALTTSNVLKSLNMSSNNTVSSAGWSRCFRLLLNSDIVLEELFLRYNNIDNDGLELLGQSLADISLTTFDMSGNQSITSAGWIEFFQSLIDTESMWENLFLSSNNIDDAGAAVLIRLLATTSTIRSLHITDNASISTNGLRAFSEVLLPSSASKLRNLRFGTWEQEDVNDDVIVAIATALTTNTSLEVFAFIDDFQLTFTGWSALARALCDSSSIPNICYHSNHTLHTIFDTSEYYEDLPCGPLIQSLLEINSMSDKAEVVRTKIIKFFDAYAIGPVFANAAEAFLPSVIGWIGKDCLGLSLMYSFVRGKPSLFR
jgi:Ran GTPase-activating protein (RanGAP) involved in mRNA processing and transport